MAYNLAMQFFILFRLRPRRHELAVTDSPSRTMDLTLNGLVNANGAAGTSTSYEGGGGGSGGTVNLTAPNAGRFVLMPGQSMKLATPTMDAGVSVTVTLDQID